jgi:hypothetical protein
MAMKDIADADAREIADQIKQKARSKKKVGNSGVSPLSVVKTSRKGEVEIKRRWKGLTIDSSEEDEQIAEVKDAIKVFEGLPRGSSYAQHRLRVLRTALRLLEAG